MSGVLIRPLGLLLLFSLACGVADAGNPKSKTESALAPTPLVAQSETTTAIRAFGAWGPAQCDVDGNLYYHSGFTYQDAVVFKVRREDTPIVYHPAAKNADDESFVGFYVGRNGELWLLTAREQELYLLEAGDDPASF